MENKEKEEKKESDAGSPTSEAPGAGAAGEEQFGEVQVSSRGEDKGQVIISAVRGAGPRRQSV